MSSSSAAAAAAASSAPFLSFDRTIPSLIEDTASQLGTDKAIYEISLKLLCSIPNKDKTEPTDNYKLIDAFDVSYYENVKPFNMGLFFGAATMHLEAFTLKNERQEAAAIMIDICVTAFPKEQLNKLHEAFTQAKRGFDEAAKAFIPVQARALEQDPTYASNLPGALTRLAEILSNPSPPGGAPSQQLTQQHSAAIRKDIDIMSSLPAFNEIKIPSIKAILTEPTTIQRTQTFNLVFRPSCTD